ncbi:hypothetical protein Tco_0437740 [Tanacetum coccineum]
MPLLSSPKPTISYFDDLDFFKDFENEFPAIVYNDAQTSKSGFINDQHLNPQHIDEFNLKDETSLSECDEEDLTSLADTDNDNDKVDIEHSSGDLSVKPLPDVINTNVSEHDKMNRISHSYQKLKRFYKGVLNLEPDFIRVLSMEEWLTCGNVSVHEME